MVVSTSSALEGTGTASAKGPSSTHSGSIGFRWWLLLGISIVLFRHMCSSTPRYIPPSSISSISIFLVVVALVHEMLLPIERNLIPFLRRLVALLTGTGAGSGVTAVIVDS